ncbi:MAG: FAD-dependent oxidoreductase, partial [Turicibacter sp.]
MYDVLIIGAGLSGSLIAYELSKYNVKVCIVDKENDIANETSMANSAIVHTGYDPKPGTLKAKLNVAGSKLYPKLCEELQVEYKVLGSLTVATNEDEVSKLQELKNRATENEVDVTLLSGDEIRKLEPYLSTQIIAGLEAKNTAVIYPWEVAIAAVEQAILNGTTLKLNTQVEKIEKVDSGFVVQTSNGILLAKVIVNAAGVFADVVGKMINPLLDFKITPRRGSYFVLDKDFDLVKRVIYPTPTRRGKGVLVVPTTHGNTLIGPDSEFIEDKSDLATTADAFDYIKTEIVKLIPTFPGQHVIRSFTGLRAVGSTGDFLIQKDEVHDSFIHVAGIESPGLASSPAIAKYVVDLMNDQLNLTKREAYEWRRPSINLKALNREEKNELIKQDASFGKLICRCEQITEGEVIDVILRPAGATTVKGV